MATIIDNIMYLPIGCFCVNQFQLDFSFGRDCYDSQLFDWSITTPDAMIEIFDRKEIFINDIGDIQFLRPNIFVSNRMPGYIVWHLDKMLPAECLPITKNADLLPFFSHFVDKHRYQIIKFFSANFSQVRCIWSNIQPNLKMATEQCGISFSSFELTKVRYQKIKSIVQSTFNNGVVVFVVRPEDVDQELLNLPDVIALDVPRSSDYMGVHNLYLPVWERFQKIA